MCKKLTISEQLELQKKDKEAFEKLCETNPEAAKALATERLTRCGILGSDGNIVPELEELFRDPWQEVSEGVFEAEFENTKAHVMELVDSGVFHWSVRFSRGFASGEADSLQQAKSVAASIAGALEENEASR